MAPSKPITEPAESRDQLLARLVHEHARLLYRVAFSVLRHPHDAEDAVQDALLKLHRTRELPALLNERAFLARTVFRTALDRKHHRRATDDVATLPLSDPRPSPETLATDADEHQLLTTLIDALPDDLREPLLLSAIEGLNSREAAAILGIPEGTVRTRLMRARNELRAHFEQATRRGRAEVAAIPRSSR